MEDPTRRADIVAFGWLTTAGSVGSMGGAALSGYLAEPSGRVPYFGDFQLFISKPYLLPGLVLFGLSLIAAFGVFWFVPEVSQTSSQSGKIQTG